jgi:hypothetical protein
MRRTFWLRCLLAALLAVATFLSSCGKQQKAAQTETGQQNEAAQKTFASPEDAARALVDAAKSDNRDTLLAIFGPGSKDVIYSGDAEKDKAALAGFASDYDVMHRWRKMPDGSEVLITGADNKSFPIPLVKNNSGQWAFNLQAGKEEILSRRIGQDENAAIDICAAIAGAQQDYFTQRHDGVKQYAQLFISAPGKQNGLYWPPAEGRPKSPLGPLVAYATSEGYQVQPSEHRPYFGYYFVMLDKQGPDAKGGAKNYIVDGKMVGGFGVLAYPAQYGDSGIKTFMVNQNGILFEKDLGKDTQQLAAQIKEFNPDKTWNAIKE